MKHVKVLFLIVFLLSTACRSEADPSPVPSASVEQATSEFDISPTNIRANGILLPIQQMELSFGTEGFIDAVEVGVGESVRTGQVLVRLDTTESELALQQAEAELSAAQANYDLVADRIPAEQQVAITAANLDLIVAQQTLVALQTNADLATAQALKATVDAKKIVTEAQRYLDSLTASVNQASVDAAYANMILAKINLDKTDEAYEPWRNKPENNTTRAAILSKLAEAQQIYDAAVRRYNGITSSVSETDLAQAEASLALTQAQLVDAQKTYENLKDGPNPDEVTLVKAQVASAQALLTLAEKDTLTVIQLELAQKDVNAARVNFEIAQSRIDKMIIHTPFDGVASTVTANQGEWAMPGEMLVTMLDTSRWYIETKNVGELQIGQIEIGQEVIVTVNAFKSETLSGKVIAISPVAIVQQGNTTYTLTIELELTDLNLWPGMTVQAEIVTK
jgi:HlyD family secretion protein